MNHSFFLSMTIVLFASCSQPKDNIIVDQKSTHTDSMPFKNGYSEVNGIKMYYEEYGTGDPLVLLHGGGSTIQTSFQNIIPQLAKDYRVIAVELQNHGRSGNRNVPQTFEQDAEDVATLLKNIGVNKASFFGFSNGGTTSMLIGIHHPEIVNKLIIASAAFKRSGFLPGFFEGMKGATLANMPKALQEGFLKVTPDSAKLEIMFERDRDRMIAFKDWDAELLKSITVPTLIINGDADVVTIEHAMEMYHLIPKCQLAILPGGHGKYLGEITTLSKEHQDELPVIPIVKEFLHQ